MIKIFHLHRFDGRVVARLPFTPIPWVQGLSHRNLPGDNYTECSFIFLYILCTMSIRQVRLKTLLKPCNIYSQTKQLDNMAVYFKQTYRQMSAAHNIKHCDILLSK